MVKTDAKNARQLGREKAVVSPSFTTTAPFPGPELVNRLELVYVLSYLVFLFEIFSFISVLFSFNHYYYSHDHARLIFASLVFYHLSGAWDKLTTLLLPGWGVVGGLVGVGSPASTTVEYDGIQQYNNKGDLRLLRTLSNVARNHPNSTLDKIFRDLKH